jgi:hypothetical protein
VHLLPVSSSSPRVAMPKVAKKIEGTSLNTALLGTETDGSSGFTLRADADWDCDICKAANMNQKLRADSRRGHLTSRSHGDALAELASRKAQNAARLERQADAARGRRGADLLPPPAAGRPTVAPVPASTAADRFWETFWSDEKTVLSLGPAPKSAHERLDAELASNSIALAERFARSMSLNADVLDADDMEEDLADIAVAQMRDVMGGRSSLSRMGEV